MVEKISSFDAAKFLKSEADIALFLSEAFATGDARHIARCLGIASRAKGLARVAKEAGIAPEEFCHSFSGIGDPSLQSTLAVLKALGMTLSAVPTRRSSTSA